MWEGDQVTELMFGFCKRCVWLLMVYNPCERVCVYVCIPDAWGACE